MNEEPVEEEKNEKSQHVQSSGELEIEAKEEVPNEQINFATFHTKKSDP